MRHTFVLCHGFGFSNDYWRNLIPLLEGEVVFFDRYSVRGETECLIGIGHSLGFQKLNDSGLNFDFLIGLQGFINFCGSDPRERKIRLANLERMIKICETDAVGMLQTFHNACGYPGPIPKDTTASDLVPELLSLQESRLYCGCPALVIGSNEDDIVPISVIKDNFRYLENVVVDEIQGVPHSLGFAKAKEVAQKIGKFCG